MRQLAAAAGDGWLGSVGSPGQLETSLNSGYTVGPCNSYLEGPTPILWACCSRPLLACCSRIARSYPPPSSLFANGKAFAHRSSDRRARDFRRSQLRGSRCPNRHSQQRAISADAHRSVWACCSRNRALSTGVAEGVSRGVSCSALTPASLGR